MNRETEHIATTLKAARESRGLSQRALSAKSGVPQGHISKIENGAVDLRVSSLVALARVLDLEPMLVPRNTISAVQSIVRSSARARSTAQDAKSARHAQKELARIQDTIASLPKTSSFATEAAQLQRQVRDLQHFRLARSDLEAIRTASQMLKKFLNEPGNLDAIRQSLSQLQSLRNALAHSSAFAPDTDSAAPAYSLDEDDDD